MRLVADEAAQEGPLLPTLLASIRPLSPHSPSVAAVGPERGWSNRERARLAAAGFRRFSFGRRILRTETAALAVSSTLASEYAIFDQTGAVM